MRDKEPILTALSNFRAKDKFSYNEFMERGLHPAEPEKCNDMQLIVNDCADELITGVKEELSDKELVKVLRNHLTAVNKFYYDTEEREFLCDCFYDLSIILNVDIKHDLNGWLYGRVFNTLMRITDFLRGSEKVIEVRQQACTGCDTMLKTSILGKKEGIPDFDWQIIRCSNCKEYNLLSVGPNINGYRYENYQSVEKLPKVNYTEEEAKVRLEQIKYFRKDR